MDMASHMKRTTIYLTDELVTLLAQLSRERGVPQAALIREALEQYGRHQQEGGLASLGSGGSGRRDLSARFDELLFVREKPTTLKTQRGKTVKRGARR